MITAIRQILVPILIVLSGVLCMEFALPISVGEFLAGIIGQTFFDIQDVPWLKFFSYLGLLCIMFLAGFEVDARIIKRHLSKSLALGISSFFVPYIIVLLIAYPMDISFKQSLVLATALSTTSLALVFTILREAGIINSPQGQILLGSAMVVDLLSMISLTVIVFEFTVFNFLFLVALIIIFIFVRKIVISIFRRYKGNKFEFELKFLLLILLALGILAEGAGIHAAVIAFFTGLMFSNIEYEHEVIMEKLNTIVFSLLAPIFFFHAGSMLSLQELTLSTIFMFTIFLIGSVAGKYFGTYLALYLLYKKDTTLAKYGGILFNYRLSFGIVTGMYAFELKIIDHNLLNVILLIVGISSIISVVLEKKSQIVLEESS